MSSIEIDLLVERAHALARPAQWSEECIAGEVGCILLAQSGNEYTGVSISAACGIGFCAEHSAIAAMVTAGESRIEEIVAVNGEGRVLPPCGRCRELMVQVNHANVRTRVHLPAGRTALLAEILPDRWQELWG